MAYFRTADETGTLEKEPFASFLKFVRGSNSFIGGVEAEWKIFEGEEASGCFKHGFLNNVNNVNGTLNYYIEGPGLQGEVYISVAYAADFEDPLIGDWTEINKRLPYFYVQNTLGRKGSLSVLDSNDGENSGRVSIKLEAIAVNESFVEEVGVACISYIIAILSGLGT